MRFTGLDPNNAPDDEQLCASSVRKPKIIKHTDADDLSDYVKVRLTVARAKALEAYREKWA